MNIEILKNNNYAEHISTRRILGILDYLEKGDEPNCQTVIDFRY